jgi:metal-responsive CopG/Arc/MetJ family transcriptional regulator
MDKKRLQFDFTQEALEEMDLLQESTGLQSRAEVIRHALRLFQWVHEEVTHGTVLITERNGEQREVVFPFWRSRKPKDVHREQDLAIK